MSTSPKRLAALASAALAVAGITVLAPTASQANPAGTDLVISEVYGAGGNTGAAFNADFVELYNPTANPVDLLGTYVTYRSASGASGGAMALRGSLAAGDHYLVRMSATGAVGALCPTPDRVASPSISMAAAGGQVLLTEGFGPVTAIGNLAGTAGMIDMVGLDPAGTNSFEGSAGPAATATQSANRNAAGTDTDNNSADFALAAPSPEACALRPRGRQLQRDDRRDPGHRHRHLAAPRRDRDDHGRRDRALPGRRLQRLLHADRRHRRRGRRDAGCRRRHLRLPRLDQRRHGPGHRRQGDRHRPGLGVRRPDPDQPGRHDRRGRGPAPPPA